MNRDGNHLTEYENRIVHKYDPIFYKSLASFCNRSHLFDYLFDKIFIDGSENVRQIKDKQVYYVSNHLSLADFLIQGYVFWKEDLSIPRFIAGENLNHWPFGHVWKKCGAISVDRNQKELSYWKTFNEIVLRGLMQGEALLNYCEGGRNYENREIMPFKEGVNRLVARAVQKGQDIWAVPMRINYDRRIEEGVLDKVKRNKLMRDFHLERGESSKEEERFLRASWEYLLAGVYGRKYFLGDVKAYFSRIFCDQKGNAYLKFGQVFSIRNFLKGQKNKMALTERLRQEIIQLH